MSSDSHKAQTRIQPSIVHSQLGEAFYDNVTPARFNQHILRYRHNMAASLIGLDGLDDEKWCDHFARFTPIDGSFSQPLALRYHGHQFGQYNPELGDGRGFLFAQFYERDTGRLVDLGTKGSGKTPYSRTADGRLTLKGAVREILATEMLHARAVPTSHTLSVIETGEALIRHDEPSPARSAVLVRLLHSHIRIGSFQRLAFLGEADQLEQLTRHVVTHYYDALDPEQPLDALVPQFITSFSCNVAKMVAGWMAAGFVHGVLNTDNFNITGDSFDYGPWRFLPRFDPMFTAAYFDHDSRYAYGRQPQSAMWALCRLADCFTESVDVETLQDSLAGFYPHLERCLAEHLLYRLGLKADTSEAESFSEQLFKAAASSQIAFDRLFYDLYGGTINAEHASTLWQTHQPLAELAARASQFERRQSDRQIQIMRALPYFTLEIEQVEAIWAPIAASDDWQLFEDALSHIRAYGRALAGDDN
ncbi:MAG: YdiU family protein [Pseudomonadota bacterium]|nr:YdiU family protein [Pseudomonadota bacterium]